MHRTHAGEGTEAAVFAVFEAARSGWECEEGARSYGKGALQGPHCSVLSCEQHGLWVLVEVNQEATGGDHFDCC